MSTTHPAGAGHPSSHFMAISPSIATLSLLDSYQIVRRQTHALCKPLEIEDYLLQSMPEASPVKWHLAHTSWFFETFLLTPHLPKYLPFHPQFSLLFNSYYESVGPRWSRPHRGLLSRPTLAEVFRYRTHVDEQMARLLYESDAADFDKLTPLVLLGVHHEQQHQELIITDLKSALALNPLRPVYRAVMADDAVSVAGSWLPVSEGLRWIGHAGDGFAFDNESPRHRVFVQGFELATHLVTNAEYKAFLEDDGYDRPELWLSDGWAALQTLGWTAPLYWEQNNDTWSVMTLGGLQPLQPHEPVCHVSYYEADAFARWAGARLPTEVEWESAAAAVPVIGHFLESGRFHPSGAPAPGDRGPLVQMFGDVWQWTGSPYMGYPGYQPAAGALGEYNGKFMCNQLVLRGASCATPHSHARRTYRNFYPPEARWQFSGIRLARDLK